VQDYKSLRLVVMICATLVNTQADNFRPVILLAQPVELTMSKQVLKMVTECVTYSPPNQFHVNLG